MAARGGPGGRFGSSAQPWPQTARLNTANKLDRLKRLHRLNDSFTGITLILRPNRRALDRD
jgi:hypothetical protein